MTNKVNFSLVGFDAVRQKLSLVKDEVRGKATRSALRRASGVLVRAAKQKAQTIDDPKTGRRIADNIRLQYGSRVFNRTGLHLYRIGVATNYKNIQPGNPDTGPKGNTPHWHLIEYGTKFAREQPYMRPTFSASINPLINRFAAELNKELDKALK